MLRRRTKIPDFFQILSAQPRRGGMLLCKRGDDPLLESCTERGGKTFSSPLLQFCRARGFCKDSPSALLSKKRLLPLIRRLPFHFRPCSNPRFASVFIPPAFTYLLAQASERQPWIRRGKITSTLLSSPSRPSAMTVRGVISRRFCRVWTFTGGERCLFPRGRAFQLRGLVFTLRRCP